MVTNMRKVYLINGVSFKFPLPIKQIILLFSAISFAIIFVDVIIAHSQNNFIPSPEWIPLIFSLIASLITFVYTFNDKNPLVRKLYRVTMIFGIIIGLVGSVFHIFGNTSTNRTEVLEWLVFGTPVFAPIAFTGMALFGLALMNPNPQRLMRLVALGFILTALTAFFDHAQTHFESSYTLIPVISGFFTFIFMWLSSRSIEETDVELSEANITMGNMYYAVMLIMIVVGLIGFYLHIAINLEGTVQFPWARMMHKVPVLAPLIFAQMGVLGILSSLTENRIRILHNRKSL